MTVSATRAIDELLLRGAVTDSYDYDAFGNEFTVPGGSNTPNEFMYRGEQWDSDLGLYYLRARYYNPLTGRFMSRDPEDGSTYDPETLHKYVYADGDPINDIDPSGEDALIQAAWLTVVRAEKASRYGYQMAGLNPWPPDQPSLAQSYSFLQKYSGSPKGCITVSYYAFSAFLAAAIDPSQVEVLSQDVLTKTSNTFLKCVGDSAVSAVANPL
jgi:RHS repeat-associated protein